MAGPPPPASWPLPLLTPQRHNRVRGRGAKKWASRYSRPNSEIPIPFPTQFPTSVVGYHQPYGSFKDGPYDYGFCPYRYGQGYMRVRPTTLPQYQMRMNGVMQNGGVMDMVHANAQVSPFGLCRRGTGVFHPHQAQVEYNRANSNIIRGGTTKQGGDHEATYQKCRNKNVSKGKNGGQEGSSHNRRNNKEGKNGGQEGSSQNRRNNKKGSKGKNDGSMKVKKEEECHDPSLPPGIVLPMEWTY